MDMPQDTSPTHYLPIRRVPPDVMSVLNEEAEAQNRSRENLVRVILADWAKRALARRQKDAAK